MVTALEIQAVKYVGFQSVARAFKGDKVARWGLYEVKSDGTRNWLVDFETAAEARRWAQASFPKLHCQTLPL